MKICILDEDEDPGSYDVPYSPESYLEGHTWEKHHINKRNSTATIKELATKGFDVFLNLTCGSWEEDSPGIEVVQALERLGQAFTGADQYFFEPSREAMKMVCEKYGLGFPKGMQVTKVSDLKVVMAHLTFPMLVKHPNSYASVGLTPKSKVYNKRELRAQLEKNIKAFGAALVEEFIEGTEYSVLISENPKDPMNPVVFTPIEIIFPEGETFKHEQLKWVDYNKMTCREVTDPKMREKLEEMGKKIFLGIQGTGYGRCDIRGDKDGNIFLLEINPNGAVLYPPSDPGTADHILAIDPRGHKYFIDLLLNAAIARRDKRRNGWAVRYYPTTGFGIFATRDFKAGEKVVDLESIPHTLLSSSSIQKLPFEEQAPLYQYSFHLSKELFYTYATLPDFWCPMNHSCEPTLWFDEKSLVLVARKAIKKGAWLTIDYGMLFTEELPDFDCHCEFDTCRKHITGSDYRLKEMEKYHGHRSLYVEELLQSNPAREEDVALTPHRVPATATRTIVSPAVNPQ